MSKDKAAESSELKVALEKLEVMHNESLVRLAIRQAEHIEKLEEKLKERDKEYRVLTDDEFSLLLGFAAKGVETMKQPQPYKRSLAYLQRKIYNELNQDNKEG